MVLKLLNNIEIIEREYGKQERLEVVLDGDSFLTSLETSWGQPSTCPLVYSMQEAIYQTYKQYKIAIHLHWSCGHSIVT